MTKDLTCYLHCDGFWLDGARQAHHPSCKLYKEAPESIGDRLEGWARTFIRMREMNATDHTDECTEVLAAILADREVRKDLKSHECNHGSHKLCPVIEPTPTGEAGAKCQCECHIKEGE